MYDFFNYDSIRLLWPQCIVEFKTEVCNVFEWKADSFLSNCKGGVVRYYVQSTAAETPSLFMYGACHSGLSRPTREVQTPQRWRKSHVLESPSLGCCLL